MRQDNLISQLMAVYPKSRPYIAVILVAAVSIAPAIPNQTYKLTVTTALSVTLLFLLFDIYRELTSRLIGIEKHLQEPEPPTYRDFNEALPFMLKTIRFQLISNQDVSIRILAVTSQFSWRLVIEDQISEFLTLGNRSQKISIELAITLPDLLDGWQQEKLKADAQRTLSGIKIFREKYADLLISGRISLNLYQFDNIPHWHGVLVDNDILFMGRSRWEIRGESTLLTVGQNTYRQFQRGDRFKGSERVQLFQEWLEAYKLRSNYLGSSNKTNSI